MHVYLLFLVTFSPFFMPLLAVSLRRHLVYGLYVREKVCVYSSAIIYYITCGLSPNLQLWCSQG